MLRFTSQANPYSTTSCSKMVGAGVGVRVEADGESGDGWEGEG